MGKEKGMLSVDILSTAKRIRREYEQQGMTLTLRQMYYQFVARGLMASGDTSYDKIGRVLTDARYDGSFPIDGLEDRGRDVHGGDYVRNDTNVSLALKHAGNWIGALPEFLLQTDRWFGQKTFVSVWVEKQALEGVFEPVCSEMGVSWFACKGYPSVSALYEWVKLAQFACEGRTQNMRYSYKGIPQPIYEEQLGLADNCVVLYFGDHDPDGWEIPRSAERNIRKLMEVQGMHVDLKFQRIGLNMSQIRQYSPPPFEAKVSSARYQSYIDEHDTDEAWELDALEPTVLRQLIRDNVDEFWDQSHADYRQRLQEDNRVSLRKQMLEEGWVHSVLNKDDDK